MELSAIATQVSFFYVIANHNSIIKYTPSEIENKIFHFAFTFRC